MIGRAKSESESEVSSVVVRRSKVEGYEADINSPTSGTLRASNMLGGYGVEGGRHVIPIKQVKSGFSEIGNASSLLVSRIKSGLSNLIVSNKLCTN